MLFDAQGERLTPSHTVKSGRRYRYYVSAALITEAGTDRAHGWRLAAREIEGAVIKILVDALTNPGIARDLDQCTGEQVARRDRGLCPLAGGWHRQPQLWHTRVLARQTADAAPPPRNRWFVDSPVERDEFELPVPRQTG